METLIQRITAQAKALREVTILAGNALSFSGYGF
jgi:hypothetical protein